jgi:hypothetical protein
MVRRTTRILAVLSGAALGCSQPSPDQAPGDAQAPAATHGPEVQAGLVGLTDPSALELHLEVPDTVALGDSVSLQLYVTNRGAHPARLRTAAPIPDFDLVVTRADGKRVWSYRSRHGLLQASQLLTLAPGESRSLTGHTWSVWDQREIVPIPKSVLKRDPGRHLAPGTAGPAGHVLRHWRVQVQIG